MELGLLSAILADMDFDQVIEFAEKTGFSCVEAACWPAGKAARRYAGVSHIDVDGLTDERIAHIQSMCEKHHVRISSLAYYPNPLDPDPEAAALAAEHIKKLIVASRRLNVGMVTTFIGRNQYETVEKNLERVAQVWPPILKLAEEQNVRVAIENCPMLFDGGQWPGGQNLMTSPKLWREIFRILPSRMLGLNFDPSHFVWQMMDEVSPLYEFRDRLFHVHIKDIKLYPDKLRQVGIMAYPLEYMSPKIPGLGDINWGRFISALTDIGYSGPVVVEIEDKSFEGSEEEVFSAIRQSFRYIRQYV